MAELRIVEYHNELLGDAKHRAAWLSACPAPSPELSQLREQYRLDEVIAPAAARGEFAQLMALTEWVHTRFRHGWHHPEPPITALRVLEAAAEGYDCNCAYFAITLAECCQALGFVARAVSICKDHTDWKAPDEGNTGHSVVEVWSHQFHKWVLLDADADASILNADNDSPLKVALDNGNLDVALVLDPSRTEEVWQYGLFHLGLMPPAPPGAARSAAGAGARPAKATGADAGRDPALWDLLRTLKAHDKESRLLRKLLEQSQQTHGLGSSADRLGTVLQQQLRAAEDSSRKLRRLLDER